MNSNNSRLVVALVVGFVLGAGSVALVRRNVPATVPNAARAGAVKGTASKAVSSMAADAVRKAVAPASPERRSTYSLDLENNALAERLERTKARLLSEYRATSTPIYEKLFSDLGIDPARQPEMIDHLVKVYEAKIQFRNYQSQMLNAQYDYRDRLQKLLGPKLEEYDTFEEQRSTRDEVGHLAQFAASGGTPLAGEKLAQLYNVIDETRPYTWKTLGALGGPYDEVPKGTVGADKTVPLWIGMHSELAEKSTAAIERARALGFSPQEMQMLERYFSEQLKYYDKAINKALPNDDRLQHMEQDLGELRKNPQENAAEIAGLERKIEWARANRRGN